MNRHPASNGESISEPVQCAQEREGNVRYHLVYMMTICILMESQGSEGRLLYINGLFCICILMESQGSEGEKEQKSILEAFVYLWNRKVPKVVHRIKKNIYTVYIYEGCSRKQNQNK